MPLAPQVKTDEWLAIRTVAISGFSADPDWEATNDIAGWLADSDPHHFVPNINGFGKLELCVTYYTNAGVPVPAVTNSRVDIEFIAIRLLKGVPVPQELVTVGAERQLPADQILQSDFFFSDQIGVRFVALQNTPATANHVAVSARIN